MDTSDALSSAAAGMRAQAGRLDIIAEDLANASTVGYRSRAAAPFGAALGAASGGVARQGALRRTGADTDLALVGSGYFAVATPAGVRYTRDGRFGRTADGSLADARGNRVLGALGPVVFPRGAHVDPDGRVMADGRLVDRLRVVDLGVEPDSEDSAYLQSSAPGRQAPLERSKATVHRGYLEESTVDPVVEMTALINTQRVFEANQKVAQRADESLRRAVTDVPSVRS